MKVAIVCPYSLDRFGGVQAQAIGLVDWLARHGQDAYVVAPGTGGGPPGAVLLGDTIEIPTNKSRAPIKLDRGTSARVVEAVEAADVVHVHEPFVPAVSLAALRESDKPLVGTFHADPGAGVRLLYRAARKQLGSWAGRLHRVTAVSSVAAKGAAGWFDDIRLIPNGIDVGRYRSDPEEKEAQRVVFVGRDEARKGLDVLLQAWPAVLDKVPSAELVVAGSQRKEAYANVRFLGPVSEERKRHELGSAVVLVAPNTGGESFGIVLVEGMAAGCALVASSLPAFHDVAEDAAIYARPGDPGAVARGIITLLLDDEVRDEHRRRALHRAAEFDGPRVADDYLKVYVEAVEAATS